MQLKLEHSSIIQHCYQTIHRERSKNFLEVKVLQHHSDVQPNLGQGTNSQWDKKTMGTNRSGK